MCVSMVEHLATVVLPADYLCLHGWTDLCRSAICGWSGLLVRVDLEHHAKHHLDLGSVFPCFQLALISRLSPHREI